MTAHHFTLIVEGPDLQAEDLFDALFEAGCDDALVGRSNGVQYLDFDRDAATLQDAILSAVADVEEVEGVEVVRLADAGLVSMADIADRVGRTRESIRLLVTGERGPGGFPPPVNDPRSRYRLWRSSEVHHWFESSLREGPDHPDDHVRTAINAGLELRHHGHPFWNGRRPDLRELVGLA
jgi:hypothetical protein